MIAPLYHVAETTLLPWPSKEKTVRLETMTPEERSARAKKASMVAAKKRTAKRLAAAKLAKKM
jgi:hypothetical protein